MKKIILNSLKAILLFSATSLLAENNEAPNLAKPTTPQTAPQFVKWAEQSRNFKKTLFKEREAEFIRLVKEGQSPKALYIGCSDSRVIPDLLIGTNPGDLFVIRTAGNFVPDFDPSIAWDGVAATIIYAVDILGIKDIIVCGHSHCGAIAGIWDLDKLKNYDYLNNWLKFGEAAKKLVSERLTTQSVEERNDLTARLSVLFQLDHLMGFPSIRSGVEEGKIFLHGWYNIIEQGRIEFYDPAENRFRNIKEIAN